MRDEGRLGRGVDITTAMIGGMALILVGVFLIARGRRAVALPVER
jgi:hypothetical protein